MTRHAVAAAAFAAALPFASPAAANEFAPALEALAVDRLHVIAADPAVVAAILERNAAGTPSQDEIEALDAEWRAQVGSGDAPLVASVSGGPAADALVAARDASQGLLTEIFAMDAVGLNVAVSDPTSDYWQGDEAKWQQTFGVGPDAIHISDVELDESTQIFQAQVSLAIADPQGGEPIGAITFGVNIEMLE
ncbi:MAG: hypothetical protein AAF763_02760 [Pseudomonadota bacterium]